MFKVNDLIKIQEPNSVYHNCYGIVLKWNDSQEGQSWSIQLRKGNKYTGDILDIKEEKLQKINYLGV